MEKEIEVACGCPKSDITSMTEAFFCFKPGTPSKPAQENEDEYEGDCTVADYADDEPPPLIRSFGSHDGSSPPQ
jgi:hypothetical protein